VTIDLCESDFDTRVAIYAGACPAEPDEAIACNDDACEEQSIVTFEGVAGDDYLIRIGGFEGAQGAGLMVIDCVPVCPADLNDDQSVNVTDLLVLLTAWGQSDVPEDLNGDGIVSVPDLLVLLAAWGPCV
jgi:hypothetical protein